MSALRFAVAVAAALAAGALAALACEGPGPGTGLVINPYDTPPNGVAVNPSDVTCGDTDGGCPLFETGLQCCAGPGAAGGGACIDAGVPCPANTTVVGCNEAADCVHGTVCCATPRSGDGGFLVGSICAVSCAAPSTQMCRTNGECENGGKCVVQQCPDGQLYELCGAYVSGGVVCVSP